MQTLQIEATKSTPKIEFDEARSVLRIEGQSYPENAFKFYEPLFQWMDERLQEAESQMNMEIYFHMPYINTSSSKCVMMLLEKLDDAYRNGKSVAVRWLCNAENELSLECAEEFKEDLTLPFEICSVEEN